MRSVLVLYTQLRQLFIANGVLELQRELLHKREHMPFGCAVPCRDLSRRLLPAEEVQP